MQNEEKYINLIFKELTGDISKEESSELLQWINFDINNKKEYENYVSTWKLTDNEVFTDEIQRIDINYEWEKILKNIEIQADAKIRKLNKPKLLFLRIAAILIILLTVGGLSFYAISNKTTKIVSENIIVEQELEDGTIITLNKNSEIKYNSKFNDKERKLKLEGDAYFIVNHNSNKPFIVETNTTFIEVVGTEFYINSNENTSEVFVKSGVVAVYCNENKSDSVHIHKGQKIKVNNEILINNIEQVENQNFISWKTKVIDFENNTFGEVVVILENTYDVKFIISDKEILNCKISGKFDNQSLESVLKIIQSILDFDFLIKDKVIEINGLGC